MINIKNQLQNFPARPERVEGFELLSQECFDRFSQEGITTETVQQFQTIILEYYEQNKRDFAWRTTISPYRVLVSEVMLQQTQTYRVAPKFDAFIERFPDFATLATTSFDEVLRYWKGLGYNRRALNLHKMAQLVTEQFNGTLPNDPELLVTFPGLGKATAASICAFAFNKPSAFIETNIRTVFIYFFFKHESQVHDKALMPLITATLDHEDARSWYYALMDYGVMLKKQIGNVSRLSKHHTKQTKFIGSNRQIRGQILELLLKHSQQSFEALCQQMTFTPERIQKSLDQLQHEQFAIEDKGCFKLKR